MLDKEFTEKCVKEWLGDVPPFPDEEEMESIVDMVEFCIQKWLGRQIEESREGG